jgi:hypothetical protein
LRKAALLALAAAAYVLAAWAVTPGFFDGIAPPEPYRWVSPPPQFKNGNQPPLPGHASFKVGSNGVLDPGTAFTGDGQASVSFIPGAFVAPPDRSPVTMDIKPVSAYPDTTGVHVATNVYCVTASKPVAPGKDVLVTLRFSDQAPAPSDVYLLPDGSQSWRRLGSTGASAPYTISTRSTALGCFMAGYPADAGVKASGPRVGGGQLVPILVAVAILVVVLAGVPLAVLRRRGAAAENEAEDEEVPTPPS